MGNKLSAGRKRQKTRVSPGREKRYDSNDVSLNFVDADDVLDCKYQIEFFTNFLIFFFFLHFPFWMLDCTKPSPSSRVLVRVLYSSVRGLRVSQSHDVLRTRRHSDVPHRLVPQAAGRGSCVRVPLIGDVRTV